MPAIAPFERPELESLEEGGKDDDVGDVDEVAESWIRSAAYTDTLGGTV